MPPRKLNQYECQICDQEFKTGVEALEHRRKSNHLIRLKKVVKK